MFGVFFLNFNMYFNFLKVYLSSLDLKICLFKHKIRMIKKINGKIIYSMCFFA
jgi:hypothetical protein